MCSPVPYQAVPPWDFEELSVELLDNAGKYHEKRALQTDALTMTDRKSGV